MFYAGQFYLYQINKRIILFNDDEMVNRRTYGN